MIKGMIFDLDGCLISEREYVLGCLENAGRHIEAAYGTRDAFPALKVLFDEKWDMLFNRYFEKMQIPYGDPDIKKLVSVYHETRPVTKLYPDVKEALEGLKKRGIQLALLTNGYYEIQKKKIETAELERFFDLIVIADKYGREYWKPDKRCYERILRQFGIRAAETAAIGNSETDFIAPADFGMFKIFIERNDRISDEIIRRCIDAHVFSLKEIEAGLLEGHCI